MFEVFIISRNLKNDRYFKNQKNLENTNFKKSQKFTKLVKIFRIQKKIENRSWWFSLQVKGECHYRG